MAVLKLISGVDDIGMQKQSVVTGDGDGCA